jgi:hypothetical protein
MKRSAAGKSGGGIKSSERFREETWQVLNPVLDVKAMLIVCRALSAVRPAVTVGLVSRGFALEVRPARTDAGRPGEKRTGPPSPTGAGSGRPASCGGRW